LHPARLSCIAVSVTRSQELAAIDDFILTYGVTRLEPRYAGETMAYVPVAIAAVRLAGLDTAAPDYAILARRLAVIWRGRR
jgi:hypothetical protein